MTSPAGGSAGVAGHGGAGTAGHGSPRGSGLDRVGIVGTGLIGTSLGQALTGQGVEVLLADADEGHLEAAVSLGAGGRWGTWPEVAADEPLDLLVAAVPPHVIADVLVTAQRLGLAFTYSHVGSVQARPLAELETNGAQLGRVVGGHPMAGRERGGPAAASASLFVDRAWVLCPEQSDDDAVDVVRAMAMMCGANVLITDARTHDRAAAAVSAVPQLAASAVAAGLVTLDTGALAMAGSGVRDTTRLAAADAELWADIVATNAENVRGQLAALIERLGRLLPAAGGVDRDEVRRLISDGRSGRDRLGGKHGRPPARWTEVQVVVGDRPGALLDVLGVCRDAAVNVEDLSIEHATGQPTGLLSLLVSPAAVPPLRAALGAAGMVVAAVVAPHE